MSSIFNLPDIDGISLLRKLRREGQTLPVLILTARDALDDRVLGLDAGSDDYMVKPFALQELNARLRALVRRSKGQAQAVLEYGELQLFPASQQVTYRGEPVKPTPHEYKLLQELITQSGRVLSRDRLQQSLYGWDEGQRATRWRCTFTICARNSSPSSSATFAASATSCPSSTSRAQEEPPPHEPCPSIRRFLLSGILALVSLSLAISGLIGYLQANHEMEELFDARLAQSARITNQLLSRSIQAERRAAAQRHRVPGVGAGRPRDAPHREGRLLPVRPGQRVHPLWP